jgi:hypothetical protein
MKDILINETRNTKEGSTRRTPSTPGKKYIGEFHPKTKPEKHHTQY